MKNLINSFLTARTKLLVSLACIVFSIQFTSAQNDPYFVNKNIGLCEIYSDSLTFEQIKDCTSLTSNLKQVKITSFIFSYYIDSTSSMLYSIQRFSDAIEKAEIEKLILAKPKTLYLTEILGESGTENLILGQRKLFFKN